MPKTPPHQLRLAIAELALEAEERSAAREAATAEARVPVRWRRIHSQLDRAARAVAAMETRVA